MYKGLKLTFVFVILTFQLQLINSQVERNHLKPLLSGSDQKTFDKIEVTYNKGKNAENEANIISSSGTTDKEKAKNEKKYTLKRLEAAQFYQKANADLLELFKDNVARFWKENKNSKIDPAIKNFEDKANELARNAKSARKVAEDLTYPGEKLAKMIEAENLEAESIRIFTKVLYAYLNYPISYDTISKENVIKETAKADSIKPEKKPETIHYLSAEPALQKDTVNKALKEKKDTIAEVPAIAVTPVVPVSNTPALEQVAPKDTASLYNMMQVKEEQVDKFNNFLEKEYPDKYENYVLNFRNLNYGDFDSLRSAWTRYNQYQFTAEEIASLKKPKKDSIEFIAEAKPDTSQSPVAEISENETPDKPEVKPEVQKPVEKQAKTNKPKKTSTPKVKEPVVPPSIEQHEFVKPDQLEIAKGFIYRVQISACRIPIDTKSLKNIYSGGLNIMELNEENWYKYAIGEFNTYAEARHLRDAVKIPGAFVIAYLNGKRIQILSTNVSNVSSEYYGKGQNITFKVQIAASKSPLNKKYIGHIYSGAQNVEENQEEGWYKYSIVVGPSLQAAKQFIENENIPGAFITAYIGEKRIELKEALKINKIKK